jgi:hypothetical protein
MSTTPFEQLFPSLPRIDREWEARKDRLMAMTAAQRVAAMRAGQLTYRELCHWSAARPDEIPIVSTGSGLGGGEFEWIAAFTPEIAEARGPVQEPLKLDAAAIARGERIRAKAQATPPRPRARVAAADRGR